MAGGGPKLTIREKVPKDCRGETGLNRSESLLKKRHSLKKLLAQAELPLLFNMLLIRECPTAKRNTLLHNSGRRTFDMNCSLLEISY